MTVIYSVLNHRSSFAFFFPLFHTEPIQLWKVLMVRKEQQTEKVRNIIYESPPSFHYTFKNSDTRAGCRNTQAVFTMSVQRQKSLSFLRSSSTSYISRPSSATALQQELVSSLSHITSKISPPERDPRGTGDTSRTPPGTTLLVVSQWPCYVLMLSATLLHSLPGRSYRWAHIWRSEGSPGTPPPAIASTGAGRSHLPATRHGGTATRGVTHQQPVTRGYIRHLYKPLWDPYSY